MSEENKKSSKGFWALFVKLGTKFLSLLVKLVKFAKVGLAAITFASYAYLYTWKFAILIMVAVGFHEFGHIVGMKKVGIKTKGFYFLPFLGGVAVAEGRYKTYGEWAFAVIMGPVFGTVLAWLTMGLYYLTHNPIWVFSASFMAAINLFNLLPINPLDGGQLLRAIAFSISKKAGFVFLGISLFMGVIFLFLLKVYLFAIILLVAILEIYFEYRNYKYDLRIQEYYKKYGDLAEACKQYPDSMNKIQIVSSLLSYFATASVLILLMLMAKHIPGADLAASFFD